MKNLVTLIIGKNIKSIGKEAFYLCRKLYKITIKSKKLVSGSIGTNAFKKINSKAVFKCPSKKTAKSYRKLLKKAGAPSGITCK